MDGIKLVFFTSAILLVFVIVKTNGILGNEDVPLEQLPPTSTAVQASGQSRNLRTALDDIYRHFYDDQKGEKFDNRVINFYNILTFSDFDSLKMKKFEAQFLHEALKKNGITSASYDENIFRKIRLDREIYMKKRAIKDFEGQYAIVSPMLNGDSADQLAINALLDTIITWLLGNTQFELLARYELYVIVQFIQKHLKEKYFEDNFRWKFKLFHDHFGFERMIKEFHDIDMCMKDAGAESADNDCYRWLNTSMMVFMSINQMKSPKANTRFIYNALAFYREPKDLGKNREWFKKLLYTECLIRNTANKIDDIREMIKLEAVVRGLDKLKNAFPLPEITEYSSVNIGHHLCEFHHEWKSTDSTRRSAIRKVFVTILGILKTKKGYIDEKIRLLAYLLFKQIESDKKYYKKNVFEKFKKLLSLCEMISKIMRNIYSRFQMNLNEILRQILEIFYARESMVQGEEDLFEAFLTLLNAPAMENYADVHEYLHIGTERELFVLYHILLSTDLIKSNVLKYLLQSEEIRKRMEISKNRVYGRYADKQGVVLKEQHIHNIEIHIEVAKWILILRQKTLNEIRDNDATPLLELLQEAGVKYWLPTPLQYGLNKLMDKIREGILKHPNRELIKAKFSEYDYGKRIRDNIRGMIGLDGYNRMTEEVIRDLLSANLSSTVFWIRVKRFLMLVSCFDMLPNSNQQLMPTIILQIGRVTKGLKRLIDGNDEVPRDIVLLRISHDVRRNLQLIAIQIQVIHAGFHRDVDAPLLINSLRHEEHAIIHLFSIYKNTLMNQDIDECVPKLIDILDIVYKNHYILSIATQLGLLVLNGILVAENKPELQHVEIYQRNKGYFDELKKLRKNNKSWNTFLPELMAKFYMTESKDDFLQIGRKYFIFLFEYHDEGRNRLSDVNGINVWVTSFSLGQIPEFIVHSLHLYLIEEADCPGKRKLVDNLSDANTKAILKEIRSDFNYLRIFVKLLATNEIHPKGLAHSWFMVLMRLVDIPQILNEKKSSIADLQPAQKHRPNKLIISTNAKMLAGYDIENSVLSGKIFLAICHLREQGYFVDTNLNDIQAAHLERVVTECECEH